jgi:hypothetical protein
VAIQPLPPRRLRVKREFDVIEKADFRDRAFRVVHDYFRSSLEELQSASDELRTRFEDMSNSAFTCTIVNRGRREGRDAHITVRSKSDSRTHFGDISYAFEAHSEGNVSNGWINIEADDYDLFLKVDGFGARARDDGKLSAESAAEWLWAQFVERAGVEYE